MEVGTIILILLGIGWVILSWRSWKHIAYDEYSFNLAAGLWALNWCFGVLIIVIGVVIGIVEYWDIIVGVWEYTLW